MIQPETLARIRKLIQGHAGVTSWESSLENIKQHTKKYPPIPVFRSKFLNHGFQNGKVYVIDPDLIDVLWVTPSCCDVPIGFSPESGIIIYWPRLVPNEENRVIDYVVVMVMKDETTVRVMEFLVEEVEGKIFLYLSHKNDETYSLRDGCIMTKGAVGFEPKVRRADDHLSIVSLLENSLIYLQYPPDPEACEIKTLGEVRDGQKLGARKQRLASTTFSVVSIPRSWQREVQEYQQGVRDGLSVRFLVTGHWRKQRHGPGLRDMTPKFIKPYFKGPEDAPFKRTVYDVRRAKPTPQTSEVT